MIPARVTIPAWTNGDYVEEFTMAVGGVPVNLTGKSFKLFAREYVGAPTTIFELAQVTSGQGVRVLEAVNGIIRITITRQTLKAAYDGLIAVRSTDDPIALAYDLIMTHSDGYREVLMQGSIVINKGITEP